MSGSSLWILHFVNGDGEIIYNEFRNMNFKNRCK